MNQAVGISPTIDCCGTSGEVYPDLVEGSLDCNFGSYLSY
jgi:hypothetical protein